mmetsp:Transcript_69570/g.125418  ORF Transcript_69570/g.125418 Transcript_69570/m.125418 type:complete len:223 (-) Transcript_69570:223-891(-)
MPCWLIQQQNVGAHEHRTNKPKLHLPTSREMTNFTLELQVVKAQAAHSCNHLLLWNLHRLDRLVCKNVLERSPFALWLFLTNAMLHEGCHELALWREAINLFIVDCPKQCALAAVVGPAESITLASLQMKPGVVQQRGSTIAESEDTIAKILAFLIGVFNVIALGRIVAALKQVWHKVLALLNGQEVRRKVGHDAMPPFRILEAAAGAHRSTEQGDVLHDFG